eukprot:3221335-Ditylum_brightwellii.AAC.1
MPQWAVYILLAFYGAILNNDAESCHNSMIPELASIHLQALGLPETAAKTSVLLNQNTKHHIKTTVGITKESY